MKEVTIVSALFNIERENMDGRKWDEYLKWFDTVSYTHLTLPTTPYV